MQITGTARMDADPQTAWKAFHDTDVLQRTIPGAESFAEIEPGRYLVTVTLGVASIKGTYKGKVTFKNEVEPESFILTLQAAGGAGTIGADVDVRLAEVAAGGTEVTWSADAIVGGAIGGVGQRMLAGVSRRMAAKFFADIDAAITHGKKTPTVQVGNSAAAGGGEIPVPAAAVGAVSQRPVAGSQLTGAQFGGSSFSLGLVMGAGIALAGVAVGAVLGRR